MEKSINTEHTCTHMRGGEPKAIGEILPGWLEDMRKLVMQCTENAWAAMETANKIDKMLCKIEAPVADVSTLTPEKSSDIERVFPFWANEKVRDATKKMADLCLQPKDFALMMAVLSDFGLIRNRSNLTEYVLALEKTGIIEQGKLPWKSGRLMPNSLQHTMARLPIRFRKWNSTLRVERNKCEQMAQLLETIPGVQYKDR